MIKWDDKKKGRKSSEVMRLIDHVFLAHDQIPLFEEKKTKVVEMTCSPDSSKKVKVICLFHFLFFQDFLLDY